MFRLRELSGALREAAPPPVTDAFALLTYLGDPALLIAIVAVYYWLSADRARVALLVAYTLLAVTVTVALKQGFALPRPPVEVRAVTPSPESYGFPSGHAIGATAVYGGLAVVDDRLRRPAPAAALATLVLLVGLSRVFIGVHYLGDIIVGHLVGVFLLGALWLTDRRQRVWVAVAAVISAVVALVVAGPTPDALFVLGGSIGALLVFAGTDVTELPPVETVPALLLVLALGGLLIGGAYSLALALDHSIVFALGGAVILGGGLWTPALAEIVQGVAG